MVLPNSALKRDAPKAARPLAPRLERTEGISMSMIGNYRRVTEGELNALLEEPETIAEFLYGDESANTPDKQLDVDKAWHAIHYLLNGTTWGGNEPLVNAVLGGLPVGEEDVGYGPARYLRPIQVAETSKALQTISSQQLWSKFDAVAMKKAEIYPELEGGEEDKEYVCGNFEELKSFSPPPRPMGTRFSFT
jgi:Domain of unknown function (DUF1877)